VIAYNEYAQFPKNHDRKIARIEMEADGIAKTVSGRRLSRVISDDPENLLVRIEFHKLAGLRTFLIHVAKHDTGDSPHHIQKFEGEIREGFKPSREITAHCFFAGNRPGWIAQKLGRSRRRQNDPRRIVRHNRIEVVRIPCPHPTLRKL
jgi:hypothetical protein